MREYRSRLEEWIIKVIKHCEVIEVAVIRRWMPDQELVRLTKIYPGRVPLNCVST